MLVFWYFFCYQGIIEVWLGNDCCITQVINSTFTTSSFFLKERGIRQSQKTICRALLTTVLPFAITNMRLWPLAFPSVVVFKLVFEYNLQIHASRCTETSEQLAWQRKTWNGLSDHWKIRKRERQYELIGWRSTAYICCASKRTECAE